MYLQLRNGPRTSSTSYRIIISNSVFSVIPTSPNPKLSGAPFSWSFDQEHLPGLVHLQVAVGRGKTRVDRVTGIPLAHVDRFPNFPSFSFFTERFSSSLSFRCLPGCSHSPLRLGEGLETNMQSSLVGLWLRLSLPMQGV